MNKILIGCGGIGGWAALRLAKTLGDEDDLYLVDGDKFDKGNFDRQLFDPKAIGKFKAIEVARMSDRFATAPLNIMAITEYFPSSEVPRLPGSEVYVAVDNHKARKEALDYLDDVPGSFGFFGANEYIDAEAYAYTAAWKDTNRDPRVYYPEILTDRGGDPLRPPCTGEEMEKFPQLATANMMAASLMFWLRHVWRITAMQLTDADALLKMPHLVKSNGSGRITTVDGTE